MKHLERDLESLEREILAQSSRVEEMIAKACRGLREYRTDLAYEVIEGEFSIDVAEVRIEEDCLKILALHQPVAIDLRRVATILKINNDLERIADLAVNIAERTNALAQFATFTMPESVEKMADTATKMVRNSLDAFVDLSLDLARRVIEQDDTVDRLNRDVIHELQEIMRSRPELVEAAMHVFSASRHIERIADHATNIAEDVHYLVDGEIRRHRPPSRVSS